MAGTVSDYGTAESTAIAQAFATHAGVSVDAVAVEISSGSVVVTSTITAVATDAASISTTLNTGILASPAALQSAVATADSSVTLTVEAIVPAEVTTTLAAQDGDGSNPCFPSTAVVTMADGSTVRVDRLKEGDSILAATMGGQLTMDTVSLLSIAMPEAQATFLTLTTANGRNLTLTPAHHLPAGPVCCSALKLASEVEVGETIWIAAGKAGATAEAAAVTQVFKTAGIGLHSPVLTSGSLPIVDGFVTSFDSALKIALASYGLPLLEAAGMTGFFRRAFLKEPERKYIA